MKQQQQKTSLPHASLKKEYQHNLDHSFTFFDENREKYIKDRQVDFETLVDLIKNR
tara:strand:- start:2457 stop:2624 length:168 start_codon:yes stop_codon:yes gene_type:complete